jgi:hypothetical protein
VIGEAEQIDAVEDARADRGEDVDDDRLPPGLVDRTHRVHRIREAAQQLAERHRRLDEHDDARDEAARARLARSLAGLPVVGCIPKGPHHLAEARAHLAREIRSYQERAERRAAIIASGKKPMGPPLVRMDQHSRIIRARESSQQPKRRLKPRRRLPRTGPQTQTCPRPSPTSPIRTHA